MCAIRIPANESLEWKVAEIAFRPPGRPSRKPLVRYKSFAYQAGSYDEAGKDCRQGRAPSRRAVPASGLYRHESEPAQPGGQCGFAIKRGAAEQWIKEGEQAMLWNRLSCHRFRAKEVRLQLGVLAYNLGNLWRYLALANRIKNWSLMSLEQRLVETGGRLIKHARY